MNWITRIFVASLLTLAGTIGYGAFITLAQPIENLVFNSQSPNALFPGISVFDMQSGGVSSAYQSSSFGFDESKTTANHNMSMTSASTAITTPQLFIGDDQGENSSGQARGTVTAVNGNMITINGQAYTLSKDSEVNGYFEVGSNVKLEYYLNPDGTLTIEELEVVNSSMMNNGSSNNQNYSNSPSSNYYYNGDDNDDSGGND